MGRGKIIDGYMDQPELVYTITCKRFFYWVIQKKN